VTFAQQTACPAIVTRSSIANERRRWLAQAWYRANRYTVHGIPRWRGALADAHIDVAGPTAVTGW
jgi:hypothetical protein